jgi:hypothetical protein
MPETLPFDDHEVAQMIYEVLFRLYVEDKEGAAREAAARGVAIESLAASTITQALREMLVSPGPKG